MNDIFGKLAGDLAKAGAPILGGLIGSAIGGKPGEIAGTLAGKAIEAAADALGLDVSPDEAPAAVQKEVARDPTAAREKLAPVEAGVPDMLPLWLAQTARAAANDSVEAEKGFGAWSMRRTVTTYAVLAMLAASFFAALAAALGFVKADTALLMILVGHAVTLFMAWNGLVSGGRAVTDAVKAYKGGAK